MVSRDKRRCKKMLEHRQMIILSLQYLLEKWLNMCIKYEIIQDKKLLENIVSEIPGVFLRKRLVWEHLLIKVLIGQYLINHLFDYIL